MFIYYFFWMTNEVVNMLLSGVVNRVFSCRVAVLRESFAVPF